MEVTVKEGKESKKKGAVAMGFDRNHFGFYTVGEFSMYIFKIACLAAPAGTVIDDFNLDFLFLQIYKCHQRESWQQT